MMRNYLLSETFGEPLLAALNIFSNPLSVSLKSEFETPPTNLSVLISSLSPLACENSRSSRGPSFEERGETAVFAGYVPVNSYIVDNKKRFLTFAGISNTSNQSLLLLHKRSWILSICIICSNRMTWGVIEEMLYILYDMIEKISKSLYYLYFLKRVFEWQKSYSLCTFYIYYIDNTVLGVTTESKENKNGLLLM